MPITPASIAQDFNDISGHIGDILANTNFNLSDAQITQLGNDAVALTGYANQITDDDALQALGAAQSDFDSIKAATSAANAKAATLKAQATRLNSILAIVGNVLSLGAAIASGPLMGVLTAATTLGQTVANTP